MDMKPIGKALQRERKKAGISTLELANRLSVTRKYIQQIECGTSVPSFKVFLQILNELDISADTVLQSQLNGYQDKVVLETDGIRKEACNLLLNLTDNQCMFIIDIMKSMQMHL